MFMAVIHFKNHKAICVGFLFVLTLFAFWFTNSSSSSSSSSFSSRNGGSGGLFGQRNNNENIIYSIVIDAGSSGSRIHVFRLRYDESRASKMNIKLVKEDLFVKIKPGLSSYAADLPKASESIRPLLEQAKSVIPKAHQKKTRISLKATAGLRMLSDAVADRILQDIRLLLEEFPFQFGKEDVAILDGKLEGIYSWLTLNYALNAFTNSSEAHTVSLDLGGGSTQCTFIPQEKITLLEEESSSSGSGSSSSNTNVVEFPLDQSKYSIFAKSYLGFGLMSARFNIFRSDVYKAASQSLSLQAHKNNSSIISITTTTTTKSRLLFSVCMPVGHESKWKQQGVEYTVVGASNKRYHSFEKCSFNVINTVQNKFAAPHEIRHKQIYAFSFFFDRLQSAGLFSSSSFNGNDEKTGGKLRVQDILEKAVSVCDQPDASSNANIDRAHMDYPFLCMDLTFIYAVLTHGYGLPNDKVINVHSEVNGMDINWALGAAIHMLN